MCPIRVKKTSKKLILSPCQQQSPLSEEIKKMSAVSYRIVEAAELL